MENKMKPEGMVIEMKYSMEEVRRVKAMGFLFNRDSEDEFSARIITENTVMTAEELHAVAEAARRFGNGKAVLTTRMTVELPGIRYDDIPALLEFLAEYGLETGGTGDKLRPVAACKGTTCVFGLADTQAIAQRIHDQFYIGWREVTLPHKFKAAVGGCHNNCVKPDLNDFGLVGTRIPGGGKKGLTVLLGGRWGRQRHPATALPGVYTVDEAMVLLEKTLLVFRKFGYKKERFGDLMDRIGFETVQKELFSDKILSEKEAILTRELENKP